MHEEVTLSREAKAVQIPYGYEVVLPAGSKGTIVQSLGGAYTVVTEQGTMVRVAGSEVEAIGKQVNAAAPQMEGEVSNEELEKMVWDQLKTCYDPEIPVNIYDLGLIYDVKVGPEGAVGIQMTLTSPHCPAVQSLPAEVESKIKAVPGVTDAKIDLVWDPPWDQDKMSEAARLQLGMM